MNHYEELAVAQDASVDEIHQAYRALARLLHPDNQPDPRLKSLAERQMLRLNEVLCTLSDPDRRREYDESLCPKSTISETHRPLPAVPRFVPNRHLPWVLAMCILIAAGLWYLRSNDSGGPAADRGAPPPPVQPVQTAAPAKTPHANIRRPTSENRLPAGPATSPRAPSTSAIPHTADIPAAGPPSNRSPELSEPVAPAPRIDGHAEALTAAPLPQTVEPKPAPPPRAADPAGPPTLAGHWFLALGPHDARTAGLYPPEFIELFLSEQQGVVSGKYWARYRIPDKPVSPEVLFRVTGAPPKGDVTTLRWDSDDGAAGQMKVALHGSNSMEVVWWTTAFGKQTVLTSGTAQLVRQQAR